LSTNVLDDMEWVRINAERERINRFKEIAEQSATLYYKVLTRFGEETQRQEKEDKVNQMKF
jgi:hypothetical protein